MDKPQRAVSAKNSRRRRWDVKSRESFEGSLAVETGSPQKINDNERSEIDANYKEPKSDGLTVEGTNKDLNQRNVDQVKHSTKSSTKGVTSKPTSAKSLVPRPVSVKSSRSKPSSAKAKNNSNSNKGDESTPDTDILSAKIGALIDEVKIKSKDSQKQPSKANDINTHSKENLLDDYEKASEKFTQSAILPKGGESDTVSMAKGTEDPCLKPSAPPLSPNPEEITKIKKHKRKSESKILLLNTLNEESFIAVQLKEMKDDIVDITKGDRKTVIAAPGFLHSASFPTISGNINAIFEEKVGGFVKAGSESSVIQKLSERLHDVAQVQTRTSHAVSLQSGFRTFSVLSQGLLAGLTLAHCLLIFLLEADSNALPGLYHARMAHVFYSLILFLSTICFVSSCDRYDLSGIGLLTGHGIKVPWTPAFYLASLVLSLVATRTEDVLAYQELYQETLSSAKIVDLVDWWRWICVARSSTAVLGWLAVVPDPHTDALLDSIQELNHK